MTITIRRERRLVIRRTPPSESLFNLHSHSQFSHKDALPEIKAMVKTVVGYGQPALGLTDHGNMAGSVQLYTECHKAGITPFPGTELYVVPSRDDRKAKRHHMCVVAYTSRGYENLVGLSTLSHRNFFNKPLVDHADLAQLSSQGLLEGIAATSGCYFSLISQAVARNDDDAASALIATYAGWFPKFYVELQNHNIAHEGTEWTDDSLADRLHLLASAAGVPVVLTQDAHYCQPTDKPIHEILKKIVAFGPESDDAVFPGDGFHLADATWFAGHHGPVRLADGSAGLRDLLNSYDLKIPELDSYAYNIPFTVADPQGRVSARCREALFLKNLDRRPYIERLDDELEIVKDTGMAGYLMLVAEVTDWCRENRIVYQARGSAAGSIICWLLKITGPDPIKWDLRFERFISRDRMKPPDIDLDIEYDQRQRLITWLRTRFSVQQIGTWIKYSLRGEETEDGTAKGSLRVAYFSRLRAMDVDPIPDWKDVPAEDKADLYTLDASTALSSYGVHPAGLVVTTNDADFARLTPLMKVASSDTMVTQYPMKDVESVGQVKLDVLGLKTLSVLNRTMTNMGRDIRDGMDWIKLSDSKTFAAISRGDTDGVFQLEGGSARRGCRELKPTKISDVIAAMALFRPATMDSGATDSYIARKHHEEVAPRRHEIIAAHTGKTHGVMLFQEQVIAILRDLGMTTDGLTDFLKAIKASQKADMAQAAVAIMAAQEHVEALSQAAGMTPADFEWLWNAIQGFAQYGFNQAHSTVYGLTAYWSAYLSVHHELEFFSALLAVAALTGTKRGKASAESIYVTAARRRGMRLLHPDVNTSGITYSVDPGRRGIRRGLVAIKGVGHKQAAVLVACRPEGGYQSLDHLCREIYRPKVSVTGIKSYLESGDLGVGTISKLHQAGAFECFQEVPS